MLSAGCLSHQLSFDGVPNFTPDEICRMGEILMSEEQSPQTAAPAETLVKLDVCNIGTNCNKVSEGDPTGTTGCFAGRDLLIPALNWFHPFFINSNVLCTGAAPRERNID